MPVDLPLVSFAWNALLTVATGIIGLYAHTTRRHAATAERIETFARETDTRLARLEEAARHAVTHDHLTEVAGRIDSVNSRLSEISGALEGIRRAVDILYQHMLRSTDASK